MDPVLKTERLKLTLITRAERGSEELSWLHELRSNKQTMAWRYVRSIASSSKRIFQLFNLWKTRFATLP
jgi:hypothetical protein